MLLFYTPVLEFLNVYILNSLHKDHHSSLCWRICPFFLSTPFTLYLCVLAARRSYATQNAKLFIFSDLWPGRKSLNSAGALGAGQKPTSCLSAQAAVCHGELGAADGDPQWWDDGLCPASCQRRVFTGTSKSFPVPQTLKRSVPFHEYHPHLALPHTRHYLLCKRISWGNWWKRNSLK